MSAIVLATLNAKYHHCAFGLRYLLANLKELKEECVLREFTCNQDPRQVAEAILSHEPRIVGLGVYIWNARQSFELVSILKKVSPKTQVILGGPEVSYETELQPVCRTADYVVRGEADFLFYELCKRLLGGERPAERCISGELPEIAMIELPYAQYSDEDIRHRVIYVEASRGCPYRCEYCLSSLDKKVRSFPLERFLAEMDELIGRGARQFKFVDRTFNLSVSASLKILEFFLERVGLGLFLHFEMVPDRLPSELREIIRKFPVGALQFEVGIQTWNPEVAARVSRRQDYAKVRENLEFLRAETGVHIHADLIAGLPGEDLESFARGFDTLSDLAPHEIQIGILKRLRGTPIVRHDGEWGMAYQEHPPYQVLSTRVLSFGEVQRLERFSHFWNLLANSGNFRRSLELFKKRVRESGESWFDAFSKLAQFLHERHPQGNGIALLHLLESAWIYFTEIARLPREGVREALIHDYSGRVKRDIPRFLQSESGESRKSSSNASKSASAIPWRQRLHIPDHPESARP